MATDFDLVVVGAGVVGLAVAQRLARDGRSVLVLEQEAWIGQHASSRNSEVIHAGIYYAPGSLKAQLCVEGRDLLYAWCAEHGVAYRQVGKLLVAVEPEEVAAMTRLQANAAANGVDLQWLDAAQVHALEPQVRAVAGLFSPLTGIIDSHALMQSFEAALQRAGGMLSCRAWVQGITPIKQGLCVTGHSDGQAFSISARQVVNAAGLFAQTLQRGVAGAIQVPPVHWCQGRYFSYAGSSPFRHLVYPMPDSNNAGLGVHATLDLAGQLRFGPDVRYTDELDYQVDAHLREAFGAAVRRYWPACDQARLQPAYAGVRAKLSGAGEPAMDFVLQGHTSHGVRGLVSMFGIESPGLTASLALAERVKRMLDADMN
ncbi:NAD(P)/FAD-dependent oxidoreductase [Halopseudomonas sp.]|uniref:NAD(P)/FAD-dependent oxidoreductase n=1 Tax=Halopseudomonas sp. TaxID=2901191 RepID=UPI003002C521